LFAGLRRAGEGASGEGREGLVGRGEHGERAGARERVDEVGRLESGD
jgi:hypothetical protein